MRDEPRVALDAEANSLFAYRESLCLLQATIPGEDFIIDPLAGFPLDGLGEFLADASIEKIFHACEYDLILLGREFDWQIENLFDTMWAARILGYKNMGLAGFLEERFEVKVSKKHQKANWGARPLTESQLAYAQMDTHFLLELRDQFAAELQEKGRYEEALEIFSEISRVRQPDREHDEHSFWSIRGAHDLRGHARAILQALDGARDAEARRRNTPPFKVAGSNVLIAIAKAKPRSYDELRRISCVSPTLAGRMGGALLQAVEEGLKAPAPVQPKRAARLSNEDRERLELLTDWRKKTAQARGVESDVVLHRDRVFEIARLNPQTTEELAAAGLLGPQRFRLYADSIVQTLVDNAIHTIPAEVTEAND
ncbi:MAG: ribonuclease D [Candidatus Hydrogenedens sp.]|nr:ribonuclease D [Candidatus Hydrogenedens sp.]